MRQVQGIITPGEYAANDNINLPPSPSHNPTPSQPTIENGEDGKDEIPPLMKDSDDEDNGDEEDDEEIEKELLQGEEDVQEERGEGTLPTVIEPVNKDIPMPGHFNMQEPSTSSQTCRSVTPPPVFYTESNQEA
ncbi:hypothetical protein H1R20_g4443, partial [Candolleomyces eurysporus]